jgi:hypothetical protein
MRKTEEIMDNFNSLACRLSPENLCCDGELSKTQVQKRFAQIKKEWKALEKEIGHTVTEDEAFQHFLMKHRKGV